MLTLLRRLFYVLAIHAAVYAAYPDTGEYIQLFAWLSVLGWCLLMILMHFAIKVQAAAVLTFLYDIFLIAVIGLAVSASMPQSDKVSVFNKLRAGQYPSYKQVKGGVNQLSGEIKDTAVKMEKTAKDLKEHVDQAQAEKDALKKELGKK